MMFIAVVFKDHNDFSLDSHRPNGDWAAFVATTKEEAINKAILAASRWEVQLHVDPLTAKSQYYGPYEVLVGELTEKAQRTQYSLVKIEEDTFESIEF